MKLIYRGKYNGNPDSLPFREHKPGAVKFKEFDDMKKMGIVLNIAALIIAIPMYIILIMRAGSDAISFVGALLSLVAMIAHEFLHAICFKEEVHLYINFANGSLFVVGPETMSKARFVIMSMLPNLIFGIIPFILFLINSQWTVLGTFGAIMICGGAGDYYNVFNALTQMPKGARTYLHKMNSYWYMP